MFPRLAGADCNASLVLRQNFWSRLSGKYGNKFWWCGPLACAAVFAYALFRPHMAFVCCAGRRRGRRLLSSMRCLPLTHASVSQWGSCNAQRSRRPLMQTSPNPKGFLGSRADWSPAVICNNRSCSACFPATYKKRSVIVQSVGWKQQRQNIKYMPGQQPPHHFNTAGKLLSIMLPLCSCCTEAAEVPATTKECLTQTARPAPRALGARLRGQLRLARARRLQEARQQLAVQDATVCERLAQLQAAAQRLRRRLVALPVDRHQDGCQNCKTQGPLWCPA